MEAIRDLEMKETYGLEYENFTVDNDETADWCIRKIIEVRQEYDRRAKATISVIQEYEAILQKQRIQAEREISYFENHLLRYFDTVKRKATKTQETYWLPSGKLKRKFESEKMMPDDQKLMERYPDFVKQTPKLMWAELKKVLAISENSVIDTRTGEIVDGVIIEKNPAEFSVEV